MPNKYLVVNKVEDLIIENSRLGIPRQKEKSRYSIFRYCDPKDKIRKQLYLQSPGTILGNLQWGAANKDGSINYAYLDLYLLGKRSSPQQTFIDFVNRLDVYFIQKIWENRTEWGFKEQTPLTQVERQWVPTMRLSALDYQRNSLKFQLPVKSYSTSHFLEMDVFDQENDELPVSLLRPEYPARGLILFKGIVQSGSFFYLDWELKQLKVKVPEQVFDTCQLSDSEDEKDDPKPIWELYEDYGPDGEESLENAN